MENYLVEKMEENIYALCETGHVLVRMYLITGEDSALLIDTGFGKGDLLAEIRKITDKPLKVVHTHADWDHVGGDKFFDEVYFHHDDSDYPDKRIEEPKNVTVKELSEGDVLKVGDFSLEVIYTPGHTRGSISFFDKEKGILFPGDSLCAGVIFLKGEYRDINSYLETVKNKYMPIMNQVKIIYPAHDSAPLPPDIIPECLETVELILENKLEGIENYIPGRDVTCYKHKRVVIAY